MLLISHTHASGSFYRSENFLGVEPEKMVVDEACKNSRNKSSFKKECRNRQIFIKSVALPYGKGIFANRPS